MWDHPQEHKVKCKQLSRSVEAPSRIRNNQAVRQGDRSHNGRSVLVFLIGLFAARLKPIHYATVASSSILHHIIM